MAQPLLPNAGYTRGTKTKDAFLSVTVQFRGLVSLTWMTHINTCTYIDSTGTTITLPCGLWLNTRYSGVVCGKKWLDKTVPGKQCLVEIQKRKRMNIILPTCFKQFFYCCFLLTDKHKQSRSVCISCSGMRVSPHVTVLVWGTVMGVPNIITFCPVQRKSLSQLWWHFCFSN